MKVIHLLPNTSENITPSLVLNDRKIVEMQVDYLLKCGYKRIACLHAITEDDYVRSQALRREAFLQLVFERHLEQESHWLCDIGWQPELIERKLSEMLAKAPCPDAFIINDAQAIGVYRCMEKLGLKPGRDIGIIGCDDLLCNQGLNVPLTTIGISRKAIAKTLGDVVDSGDFNEIRELNVELIERESTKH